MDVTKFKRDPLGVKANFTKTKDKALVCKKDCTIMIPVKYRSRGLANLENQTRVAGIFAMIVGDKYHCVKVDAMIDLTPTSSRTVEVNGEEYLEFFFSAGSKVWESCMVVQTAILLYYISEHFYSRGDVPWYMNMEDFSSILETAKKHAGNDLSVDPAILEVIAAHLARDPKDRTKFIRHSLKTQADFTNKEVAFISLKNIELGATNTVAKLMGSYYGEGLSSALVTDTTKMEGIEELLRR